MLEHVMYSKNSVSSRLPIATNLELSSEEQGEPSLSLSHSIVAVVGNYVYFWFSRVT